MNEKERKAKLRTFPYFVLGALQARRLVDDTKVLNTIEKELLDILPKARTKTLKPLERGSK